MERTIEFIVRLFPSILKRFIMLILNQKFIQLIKKTSYLLSILFFQSCSFSEPFTYESPLSWIPPMNTKEEQLIRITHWDLFRKQIKLKKDNYLDTDFWLNYGLEFHTCHFTMGNLDQLLIQFDQEKFSDLGKQQLGISILDIEWELSANYSVSIFKVTSHVSFKILDDFLEKHHFSTKKIDGITYYHLDEQQIRNYTPSPSEFSKRQMRQLSTIYIDRDKGIVVVSYSPEEILPFIKAKNIHSTNKTVNSLNLPLLHQTFGTHHTLLVSNRQHSIKSHWTPKLNIDSVCQERLKISHKELSHLHSIPLRVMGINASSQSAQIMAVFNSSKEAQQDQQLREHLLLNAPSFAQPNYLWQELYLNYTKNELKDNCLLYHFETPQKGCFNTIVMIRDFPFLIAPD